MKLNRSGEDYLKAVFVIGREKGEVRSADIAKYLGVTRPSVFNAVRLLIDEGYLLMDDTKRVSLTESGRGEAEKVYERHLVIRELLLLCGVEPEIAESDACRIEHDISERSLEKLRELLKARNENRK